MKTQTQKRNGKKAAVLAALALLLVACVAMGTMAWLTATDELTNAFTVGEFKEPDTDDDTTTPDKDPSAPDVTNPNVSGYMIDAAGFLALPVEYNQFASAFKRACRRVRRERDKSILLEGGTWCRRVYAKDVQFVEVNGRFLIYHLFAHRRKRVEVGPDGATGEPNNRVDS